MVNYVLHMRSPWANHMAESNSLAGLRTFSRFSCKKKKTVDHLVHTEPWPACLDDLEVSQRSGSLCPRGAIQDESLLPRVQFARAAQRCGGNQRDARCLQDNVEEIHAVG